MDDSREPIVLSGEVLPPAAGQGAEPAEMGLQQLQLVSRFVLGALLLTGEGVSEYLRSLQGAESAQPGLDQESTFDLLRHLGIGLVARGQRRLARRVRGGLRLSRGAANWLWESLDRATDNRLTQPVRRSVEARLQRLQRQVGLVVIEGRHEEQSAKQLTSQVVSELVDEVIAYVAENPRVGEAIQRVIAGQGAGLAGVMVDNTRRTTVAVDELAERIARKVLGRRPRPELPPSPLLGEPQTMYLSDEAQGRRIDGNRD